MTENIQNSNRLAKNTAFLYLRMLFTIGVGLYTSRIVLIHLGVQNFGIYNVVGGIVTMFSIISASLSTSISRFLTFELGKNNNYGLRLVFSTSLIILSAISLIVALLVESIGLWFLNNEMSIPPSRITAANWVLQCSLFTFIVNMMSVPFNAIIIAHERMKAFAYISILEVSLKLGVAFLLSISIFDSLIFYAVMLSLSSLIIRCIYNLYCRKNFFECKFKFIFEKSLLKKMLSFTGWNFIGSSSAILRDQGINIAMNVFCGTTVNAARGIAVQVNNVVAGFTNNFMIAVNPQIIKSYANEQREYMFHLMRNSSKLSYYLLLIISLPIILTTPYLLKVWLTVVPEYTVNFTRLILIFGMSEAISLPMQFVNQASGKIKLYQLTVGGLQLLNFPVSFVLLYLDYNPCYTFIVSIVVSQICLFARLIILNKTVGLDIRQFLTDVYIRITATTACAIPIPLIFSTYIPADGLITLIANFVLCVFISGVIILFTGCNLTQRRSIFNLLASKLKFNK